MSQYILSLSYGKDSLACLGAIEKLGWPLDRIVHAEIWATDTISADLPPMLEFKKKADAIIKERFGIEVEHVCAMRNGEKLTYEKLFYHVPKRKNKGSFDEGSCAGFPYTKGAWCNDRLKTNTLDASSGIGGGLPDSRIEQGLGAARSSRSGPCGFPFTIGSWCKKLKDGTYPWLPHQGGDVVQQRSQTESFHKAPLHKERIQILCSISASQSMIRSA